MELMTIIPEHKISLSQYRPEHKDGQDSTVQGRENILVADYKPESPVSKTSENSSGRLLQDGQDSRNRQPDYDRFECQTCKNRKYQDGSDDPGVSFKTPSRVSPEKAASAVRSHENEHVTREQAKADREGREVVSQSVTYQNAICPECGRVYVSGGTTRTVTQAELEQTYGLAEPEQNGESFAQRA